MVQKSPEFNRGLVSAARRFALPPQGVAPDAGGKLRVQHPLVSHVGSDFVVAESDARVLHASSMRLGLMRAAGEAGARVAWVTPSSSSLTLGMLRAMRGTGGRWIVRDPEGLRFAGTGVVVSSLDDVFSGPEASTVITLAGDAEPGVPRTLFSLRIRHKPTSSLLLGGTIELLGGVLDRKPSGWGTSEPALTGWSRGGLTEFLRARVPAPTRLFVEGEGLVATTSVRRGTGAMLEETHLLLEGEALPREAERVLRRLEQQCVVVKALGSVDRGSADLTTGAGVFVAPRLLVSVAAGAPPVSPTADGPAPVSRFGTVGSGRVLTRFDAPDTSDARKSAAARLDWQSWAEDSE
ncbi:DUF6177 family protein [Pseudoclavibacter sp. AY1F1]|uniref:DUF6177 family protein n=1 Tax=Pseudoclavibacter sp. AY1F1 TaxID=2080583 RepID=UPI0011B0347A|nr:DUF6177 family protein [Pseudoclavibacter sp. AY1F1]